MSGFVPAFVGVDSAEFAAALGCHAGVVVLRLARGPADIARLVVAVVVDSVKRQLWRRTSADVRQKRLEALTPLITDANTSSAVVREGSISRIVAPALYVSPDLVLWRAAHRVRALLSHAPARTRCATAKAPKVDVPQCAAAAPAQQIPNALIPNLALRAFGHHRPVSKSRSRRDVAIDPIVGALTNRQVTSQTGA